MKAIHLILIAFLCFGFTGKDRQTRHISTFISDVNSMKADGILKKYFSHGHHGDYPEVKEAYIMALKEIKDSFDEDSKIAPVSEKVYEISDGDKHFHLCMDDHGKIYSIIPMRKGTESIIGWVI